MTPHEQGAALHRALPRLFNGRPPEHDHRVGGHVARMFMLGHAPRRVKASVASQWVREAREALVSRGMVSLSTVQQALGERVKGQQLTLF